MTLDQILALRPLGDGRYEGLGPAYPWGGLYGGQLIAQALMAAGATVAPERRVHSLHAHFIRRGDNGQPVEYRVESERDGGSFSTRLVHAWQGERRLLAATLSFTTVTGAQAPGRDLQDLPAPQAVAPSCEWFSQFERRGLPAHSHGRLSAAAWCRLLDPVPDEPLSIAAALAFVSDDLPTEAVLLAQPGPPSSIQGFFSASLDHSLWFHDLPAAADWSLWQFDCVAHGAERGLAQGAAFGADGRRLVTVAQEVLLRDQRPA